jgi:hypothetical protein
VLAANRVEWRDSTDTVDDLVRMLSKRALGFRVLCVGRVVYPVTHAKLSSARKLMRLTNASARRIDRIADRLIDAAQKHRCEHLTLGLLPELLDSFTLVESGEPSTEPKVAGSNLAGRAL